MGKNSEIVMALIELGLKELSEEWEAAVTPMLRLVPNLKERAENDRFEGLPISENSHSQFTSE